jgi:hypothetical protein
LQRLYELAYAPVGRRIQLLAKEFLVHARVTNRGAGIPRGDQGAHQLERSV